MGVKVDLGLIIFVHLTPLHTRIIKQSAMIMLPVAYVAAEHGCLV